MLILSIDPGGTTGLASNINGQYETWVQPDRRELYDFISTLPNGVIVLVEQFVTSNIHSHKWGIFTTEIVGGVEAVCHIRGLAFHRRTNIQRLPYMQKAKAILDAKKRRYVDHEMDSLAHILGYERHHVNKTT